VIPACTTLRRRAIWLAMIAISDCLSQPTSPNTVTGFELDLDRSFQTSAGIYGPSDKLIRTLWSDSRLAAGKYRFDWDGKDDSGKSVSPANVSVRVIAHNISSHWDGVIGNTSASFTGSGVHRSMFTPTSIAIIGQRAYYAAGYNEWQAGTHGFALDNPQARLRPLSQPDPFSSWELVASDGRRIYWASAGGLVPTSFVLASSIAEMAMLPFAAGTDICLNYNDAQNCHAASRYRGVIDHASDKQQAPTGLAVQSNGPLLAVAHGRQGLVKLFDKVSGKLVRSFAIPTSADITNQIAIAPNGDLWVLAAGSAIRYTALDSNPAVASRIEGLSHPLAIAVDPRNDDIVLIADGGSSQQVKAFDHHGRWLWSYGKPGGAATDPESSFDKLWFRFDGKLERTALAVAQDGSFWVVDTCNNRMLHVSARRTYMEQIAYLPVSYSATVDPQNPRRVFANYLEFESDPDKPLQPGPGGWKLRRNWLAGFPAAAMHTDSRNGGFTGLQTVVTLPNERTYAFTSVDGKQFLLELPSQGPARAVRSFGPPASGDTAQVLYETGELGYAHTGSNQSVYRSSLVGFGPTGEPQWEKTPRVIASVFAASNTPVYKGAFSGASAARFPVTASGKVIFFDQSVAAGAEDRLHLGAVNAGGNEWAWQASPAGTIDEPGRFQTRSIDGHVNYGGNMVWAVGQHIVFGYHGEGFADPKSSAIGQANQFYHFHETGLLLGQFGVPTTRASGDAAAGVAGNAFSNILLPRGSSSLLLFHNEELQHGGVHRWTIDNLDSLHVFSGSGPLGTIIRLRIQTP
jgi:hypothetical protein